LSFQPIDSIIIRHRLEYFWAVQGDWNWPGFSGTKLREYIESRPFRNHHNRVRRWICIVV